MPRYAESVPVPAAPLRVRPTSGAASARPGRMGPTKQPGAIWHVLQLKAGRSATPAPDPASRSALPTGLKRGIEQLSGFAMGDVRVHRNSPEPAKLGALAYAKGSDIHLGPGQEQHLPHEAWHVVQQKQGRVAATAQLKGVGVNADIGLEAEADREGARAAALPPGGGQGKLAEKRADPSVVQGKFRFLDLVLEDKNLVGKPVPERLQPHHEANDIYEVRDDWDLDFKDIHLIYPDYVYLLGEIHGSGTWETQTKNWTRIGKMRESMKTVPGVKPSGAGTKNQPLENLNAFLLHVCLHGKSEALAFATSKPADLPKVLKNISWAAGQVLAAEPVYTKWVHILPQSAKLEEDFLGAYAKLAIDARIAGPLADKLIADLAKQPPDPATLERIRDTKEVLSKQITFFAALVDELVKVMKIGAQSASGLAVAAELKAGAPVALKDSAAMAVREEAMVTNIKAASKPLLVQVGDGHVESLAAKLPKVVKVRAGQDLATATKV